MGFRARLADLRASSYLVKSSLKGVGVVTTLNCWDKCYYGGILLYKQLGDVHTRDILRAAINCKCVSTNTTKQSARNSYSSTPPYANIRYTRMFPPEDLKHTTNE